MLESMILLGYECMKSVPFCHWFVGFRL